MTPHIHPNSGQSYPGYPNLRAVLDPKFALLPPGEIEALMESLVGPHAAEQYEQDLEGIFGDIGRGISSAARDVGRFAKKAAPVVANIGGGALKGALAGSALGLPGIIGGAVAGGVGTGLSSYAKGPARNVGNILGTATNLAGQFSPAGRVGAGLGPAISGLAGGKGPAVGTAVNALGSLLGGKSAGTAVNTLGGLLGGGTRGRGASSAQNALGSLFGGSSAAGQLLSALRRPEIMQALVAAGLGPVGRSSVPIGRAQTPVPVGAVANLIGQLANQAAAEAAALSDGAESTIRYMTDETGEYIGDPASEQDRAARLWDLLNEAQAERVVNTIYQQASETETRETDHRREYPGETSDTPESGFYELYGFAGEDYLQGYGEDLAEDDGEDFIEDDSEYLAEDYGEDLAEDDGEHDEEFYYDRV